MTHVPDCPFGWPARFRVVDLPRVRAVAALFAAVAVGVLTGWVASGDTDELLIGVEATREDG